ncbi:MAG TPA: M17 family metallopeptidase [Steroidobacteraceae bacterium]|nr:M17 family metallopeptidase [Steroidobacteraceae bacterium]
MSVKESGIVELLPAQRDVRISTRATPLDERAINSHDAVIVICDHETASTTLRQLPFGNVLERSHKLARSRSPVSLLSTHVGAQAIPLVLAFAKPAAKFEYLTLAGRAWKALVAQPPRRLLICAWNIDEPNRSQLLEAFAAASLAGSAPMPSFKSERTPTVPLEAITLFAEQTNLDVARTLATDRGNHIARWLTTLPPNVLDSAAYRRAVSGIARRERFGFTFLNTAALERAGAGAFLAVARANDHANAGIIRLRRRAHDRNDVRGRIALVGKGICFDTGGINLKPHKSMYQMHEDMQGSAVALGTLLALHALDAPFDVDCWLAITENNIGPRAYRPQEVVTAANGVTIQIVHSDAEGRMALADTLALAVRDKPDVIMEFATLTGACVTALTDRFSGVFTNRPEWHGTLERTGRESGERVWPFPMDEDFDAELESPMADVLQCTLDSKGDHILAARFLSKFVPATVPWIHVDLAASNRPTGLAHVPTDFTGFGVRYATQLLLDGGLIGNSTRSRKRSRGTAS